MTAERLLIKINQISPTELEITIDKEAFAAHQRHITTEAIKKINEITTTTYAEWQRVIAAFNAPCYIQHLYQACTTYDEYYLKASLYLRPYIDFMRASYHDNLYDDIIDAQHAQLYRLKHLERIDYHCQMYRDLILQRVLITGYFRYLSRSNYY